MPYPTPAPEDVAKLPKWAQQLVAGLLRDRERLQHVLGVYEGTTPTRLLAGGDWPRARRSFLHEADPVTFRFGTAALPDGRHHRELVAWHRGDHVEVRGDGGNVDVLSLAVEPVTGNVVRLYVAARPAAGE